MIGTDIQSLAGIAPLIGLIGLLLGLDKLTGSRPSVLQSYRNLKHQVHLEKCKATMKLLDQRYNIDQYGSAGPPEFIRQFWARVTEIHAHEKRIERHYRTYKRLHTSVQVVILLGLIAGVGSFLVLHRILVLAAVVLVVIAFCLAFWCRHRGEGLDELGELAVFKSNAES